MIKHVRFAVVAAALSLFAVSTSARAQENKPGGLNKVAHDVSNTAKKAGRDTKAEVKRDASNTHATLRKAGNDTKAQAKRTTGIQSSQRNQPGGLNKVARNISKASKNAASNAKAEKNKAKSSAHGALTETGNDIKAKAKP